MRLTPPRPKIEFYKEGFGDNAVLGRKKNQRTTVEHHRKGRRTIGDLLRW